MGSVSIKPVVFLLVTVCLLGFSGFSQPGAAHVTDRSLDLRAGTGKMVYPGDLEYLGAFRVPKGDLGDNTTDYDRLGYGGSALAYNPIRDTLFIVGHPYGQRLVEISIPDVVNSTNLDDLNTAEVVQKAVDITEGHLDELGENGSHVDYATLGDFLVYHGRLIGSAYSWYDGGYQGYRSHFYATINWSTEGANFHGMYMVGENPSGSGPNGGFVGGYMALIPPEWRDSLGGPALTGLFGISIVSRTSYGPDAWVFDPDDIGVDDPVNATMLLGYPGGHTTIGGWSSSDGSIYFDMSISGRGIVFPWGTDSVLFFGYIGLSENWRGSSCCYGEGTSNFTEVAENGYCWDPVHHTKGTHGYPYVYRVWAYDAKDLLKVKEGMVNPQSGEPYQPWDLKPYAVWDLYFPFAVENAQIKGVAYDPSTQRLFVSIYGGDASGYEPYPLILVYRIHASEQVKYTGSTMHIRINNDAEFSQVASEMGWSGDGSESNPYVIEGYTIDAERRGPGIYIGNTTVHFVVRNNRVFNATWNGNMFREGAGVLLYNATNATVENNTFESNDYGVLLLGSSGNSVVGNTISRCYYGVYLGEHSDFNMVFENHIDESGHAGIVLYGSSNNTLWRNSILGSNYDGIALLSAYNMSVDMKSNWNVISANSMLGNGRYGVYIFYFSAHNLIYNNTFAGNHFTGTMYDGRFIQAYDSGIANTWNTSSHGNYWREWAMNNDTNDQNNDGVVDYAYHIAGDAGAMDYLPLKNQPEAIPEVSPFFLLGFLAFLIIALGVFRFAFRT